MQQPLAVAQVTGEWFLIGGRNRREACRRAQVTPHWTDFHGTNPVAYVLSANVHRRHLSKGQLAMAVAKIYADPRRVGVAWSKLSSHYTV